LAGGRDSIKWEMITWIWKTRDASKYQRMGIQSGLPMVTCNSLAELQQLYQAWALPPLKPRPSPEGDP
ncbi:MAG: hypothetical protein MO852_12065, partial [Candidatus Devosia euplotis]|nr:hypothetical protein [Candidatus Devosia euplotis]